MFLWYFVLPEVVPTRIGDAIKQTARRARSTRRWSCLGFFTASRVAEQVRAGIQSLPRGQRMAGTAMGFTTYQTYRYVLLPNAYRIILPPMTSEFLNNLKNTSVALTIGLLELTARARSMQEFSFQVFEAFTAATAALRRSSTSWSSRRRPSWRRRSPSPASAEGRPLPILRPSDGHREQAPMLSNFDFYVIGSSLPYLFGQGMVFTADPHRHGGRGRRGPRHAAGDGAAVGHRRASATSPRATST